MLYQLQEFQRAMLEPLSSWAKTTAKIFTNPSNPMSHSPLSQRTAAGYELLHRLGKEYEKPDFNIKSVQAHGKTVAIAEIESIKKPFCRLLRFKRFSDDVATIKNLKDDPIVLLVAPLSGHHASLLRDSVKTLLQNHKVYVTDWTDARLVPESEGTFGLDDYVFYIQEFIRFIGAENLHVVSVCQPTVPVLAAISLMATNGEKTPLTMTMMGGPIDARKSPTAVNSLAMTKSFEWFENNVIYTVPANHPGAGRKVYPGFLQHAGFVAMNPDRHMKSHWDYFQDLIKGDSQDTQAHRRFYDEYNAVLDMDAKYYLETIKTVFQEFALPLGTWKIKGQLVRPQDIKTTALLAIEGELDDISGSGQTRAAIDLCKGINNTNKSFYEVKGAGHYGIFSGRRWREKVHPVISQFIRAHQATPATVKPVAKKPTAVAKPTPKQETPVVSTAENKVTTKVATKLVSDLIVKPARKTTPKTLPAISNMVNTLEQSEPVAKKVVAKKASTIKKPAVKNSIE
ncbi:polyhydroxyalkanoate depolymerase [Polynucleobacter kasalickyi]|uniref:Poly(3-hydroxybutyrate) depolymerase n=1 Tax=Polynucleobacter kasalickyi TaxID=1938817 RepID=A0A1W1Y7S4_9BURK|nr:polyhydroxyalkanoate depolymerase [Polynucleobacter kasalickyi]SMC32206.1 poly(3-hydroxybutyrate) depolymerase [Polynucleobacter kasalickyi]